MNETIYYLPGMGDRLNTGLGKGVHIEPVGATHFVGANVGAKNLWSTL
jgi:hypothetical protein